MTTDATQRSTSPSTTSSPARLQEAASDIADSAGQAAQNQASVAMQRTGETLQQVAEAIRDTGNQLRGDRPEIAGVADTAAQRIDQLASYVREHDARDLIDEAERFARRQPAVVIGGGLALGLIVGRLLRSGAEPMDTGNGWHSGMSTSRWTGDATGPRTRWSGSGSAGSSSTAGTGYGTSYGSDEAGDDWATVPTGSTTAMRGTATTSRGSRTTATRAGATSTSDTEG